jgi:hypothetical protein
MRACKVLWITQNRGLVRLSPSVSVDGAARDGSTRRRPCLLHRRVGDRSTMSFVLVTSAANVAAATRARCRAVLGMRRRPEDQP